MLDKEVYLCYDMQKVRKVILLERRDTMKSARRDDRHYMSSVRVGPKGQIVIPKEAREMFGIEPGDLLVLLADKKRGIALQTPEKLHPMLKQVFDGMPEDGGEEE